MRIALAGAGAFGEKHLDGLKNIDGVEIISIISRTGEHAAAVAKKYGAKHSSTELDDALDRNDVDAVILSTPTQMHAEQAIACMAAGKHVQIEIPLPGRPRQAKGNRTDLHGGPHTTLQPFAPVRA
jgi:2-hydroxy-4-carboxymuconate semialdehyde hemiacetal dehydrogenase